MTRNIVVNGAILGRSISGIPRATRHLIEALDSLPDTSVRSASPAWQRKRSSLVNALHDTWWDLRGAEKAAGRADLLVSPCNIGRATKIPSLLVVYDIMPLENPEYFDKKFAAYYAVAMPYALRRADRVVTNSEQVRRKLLALAPNADVHVLPLPGGRVAKPQVEFSFGPKSVLVVGATEPHKNQIAAVRAVRMLRETTGEDVRLNLVGPSGRAEEALAKMIRQEDPNGIWAFRHVAVSDEKLDELYGSAWILLQPSINEGYGLPLVEAADRGLPTVHSGAGAMTEVAPLGDAGGTGPEWLAASMLRLLDRPVWQRHADGGRETAGRRSWDSFQTKVREIVEPLLPPVASACASSSAPSTT